MVIRIHGMDECGVRFSIGPPKNPTMCRVFLFVTNLFRILSGNLFVVLLEYLYAIFVQLFDYNAVQKMPGFPRSFEGKLEYRVLPKEYSTNSAIHIFGDYIITYTGLPVGSVPESTVFFVLHSKDLAESYRTWFWYMWGQSAPKKVATKK